MGFTLCSLPLAGCKAPTKLSQQDVLGQTWRVFLPQAQPITSSCHGEHLFGRSQGYSNSCLYYSGNYAGNGPGSIHPSLSTCTYGVPSTVQPQMGLDGMEQDGMGKEAVCTKSWVSHMHFWLDKSILHTHPHSSIPIITLIKTTSQMTGHVSVLKTVPTISVQRCLG